MHPLTKQLVCLFLVGFVGGCPVINLTAKNHVYLAVSGENRIAVFAQNETSGKLEHIEDIATSGSPKTLSVSPDRRYLFASISGEGKIASFAINQLTGTPTLLGEVETGSHASFFDIDDTGTYLLSTYYGLGQVMVHKLKDGVLSTRPLQIIETDERAHSVVLDSSNRFLFVSHTRPNSIFQFHFDRNTGFLTPNEVPRLRRTETAGPRHLRFDATGNYGYGSDEQGNSVTTYRMNKKSGQLEKLQTLTTLPTGFEKDNATSDIQIHPNGRFIYVANRGHDSLAAYEVDKNTGTLSFIDWFPSEQHTRSFAFSKDGKFLYAAGSRSGQLSTSLVDSHTGRLTRIDTIEVGRSPWWVLFVELAGD